jgi:hypothetical protein
MHAGLLHEESEPDAESQIGPAAYAQHVEYSKTQEDQACDPGGCPRDSRV